MLLIASAPVLFALSRGTSLYRRVGFVRNDIIRCYQGGSSIDPSFNLDEQHSAELGNQGQAAMSDRKRSDLLSSASSTGSPKRKGGGERLIDSSRDCGVIRNTFVSGVDNISSVLVNEVSKKASEFYMTFEDPNTGNNYYHGQGGFIRGNVLAARTRSDGDGQPEPKRTGVDFEEDRNYEATPVTAKHNLKNDGNETYLRTTAICFDHVEEDITLPDGGCTMSERIEVRPATATKRARSWSTDDISFGDTIKDPSNILTKESRLFEKVPNTFRLRGGHKIGVLVFRTFDITHKDAKAPLNTDLVRVYGEKYKVCIYTGQVTSISANGRTFCHDINTFKGCSGAIVFLLDQNQSDDVTEECHGRAVGINVGGLDVDNNLGFLINSN